MAMSATERRIRDRERKRAQRAALRTAGVPEPATVYHSIVEAMGFSMVNADRRTWIRGTSWCPVNASVVFAVAVDILVERCGCEKDAAKAAVKQALRHRSPWRLPDYVPSSNPAPGRPRYRLAAPDQVVVRTRLADTPVTPTGRVSELSADRSDAA
jgi:hypothetical protein